MQNQIKLIATGTPEHLHDFTRRVMAECTVMGVTIEIGAVPGKTIHNPVTGKDYPVVNPPRQVKKGPAWLDEAMNEGDGVYRP